MTINFLATFTRSHRHCVSDCFLKQSNPKEINFTDPCPVPEYLFHDHSHSNSLSFCLAVT